MKQFLCTGRLYATITLLSSSLLCYAQNETATRRILDDPKVEHVVISKELKTPALIQFKATGDPYVKNAVPAVLDRLLPTRKGIDALQLKKESQTNNRTVLDFQQYYKGVKVDRGGFKAIVQGDRVKLLNGAFYNIPSSLSTNPVLPKERALALAKLHIHANLYMQDELLNAIKKTSDLQRKALLQKELASVDPGGELVIIRDFDKTTVVDPRLAYKFNLYASQPLGRYWVYVDAQNGKILLVDAIIKHVNENPPATASIATTVQTRYAGARSIRVKQISGNDPQSGLPIVASNPTELYIPGSLTYALIDDTRGNGIETYDLNGVGGLPVNVPTLYVQGKSFTDMDNNWSLTEHKRGGAIESENDDIAWDAHWGAGVVYDYWGARHNRLSFDNNNGKIKSFIHSGLAFDNAFWNGEVMTYGDGSGTAANGFKPLTSLDVCGHEIGHGVCEYTANLVYAKESGAMNEGFSDIWASCIEYYAIKNIDPAMAAVLKPFYIGEQISADPSVPLRRMDNPKAKGDPDTYGGQNWSTQDCSPTLANDQCGVHTNSNVLNKWFYLLTIGSGAGSGPDIAFAGEDDGINDAGNAYQVTGLGFAMSEKIAYLTELLLSSNATYEEARNVSIAVATELSGNPCSEIVESVTNAWYAVGVGGKFVKPCVITYGFTMQPGAAISEASSPSGCNASKTFNIPVVLPANGSATIAVTGTAGLTDYSISSSSLQNNAATISTKNIIVTIINDGATEGDEYLQLSLTVSNAGANPVNSTYRLTILDDDIVPVIGNSSRTLLNESFTRADGFADPAGWTEILEKQEAPDGDPLATGKNQWGVFDNKLAITGREGLTGTQLPNGTYNSNSNSQTLIKSPLLDARGLSLVTVKFDYTVQGEMDVQSAPNDPENLPVFDYMALAYSLDGVNFIELNTADFKPLASVQPASGSITGALPPSLANKQFYLGFRWHNDDNAGGPVSCSIDNLLVTAATRTIENDAGHGGRESLPAGADVFFYSSQDGQVVTRIQNASGKDDGCTNAFIEKAGNGSFNLYQNNQGLHKVADKILRVETALSYKATTTLHLYFTETQLQALELATGQNRTSFSVYHIEGISYSAASQSNTKKYAAVYTAIPGVGGYYTVTHSDRANGSYALGTTVSLLLKAGEQPAYSTNATDNVSWSFEKISPNPITGRGYMVVNAPAEQRLRMEFVNELKQQVLSRSIIVPKGRTQLPIEASFLRPGRYIVTITDENGRILNTQLLMK